MTKLSLDILDKIISYVEESSAFYVVELKKNNKTITRKGYKNCNVEVEEFICGLYKINNYYTKKLKLCELEINQIILTSNSLFDSKQRRYYKFEIEYKKASFYIPYRYKFNLLLKSYYIYYNDCETIKISGYINTDKKTVCFIDEDNNFQEKLNYIKIKIFEFIREYMTFKSSIYYNYDYLIRGRYISCNDIDYISINFKNHKLGKPPLSKGFIKKNIENVTQVS